jgi:ABC-type multidrug transport system ATPase subunit
MKEAWSMVERAEVEKYVILDRDGNIVFSGTLEECKSFFDKTQTT